jgi:hypothetical protein
MKRFLLLMVVLFLTSLAYSQSTPPAVFFSDLTSGPNTGGQSNSGAFVTIHGKGFGASQGSSTVTVGGGAVAGYESWSDTAITFQLGAAAQSGSIVVSVNGVASNSVPFTVRAGNIYFVSSSGSDSNAGSYAAPWATVAHAAATIQAGDIIYVENGYSLQAPSTSSSALALSRSGTTSAPMAIVGYPGSTVTIGSTTGAATGIAISGKYWTIAGVTLRGAESAISTSSASGIRLAANDLSCPNGNGYGSCLATKLGGSLAILGNNIHDTGTNSGAGYFDSVYLQGTTNVEFGWNNVTNTGGRNALGAKAGSSQQYPLTIHDNYFYNTRCTAVWVGIGTHNTGPIKIYNNIIELSGTGPALESSEDYAALYVGGGSTTAAQIYNNTIYDAGSMGGSMAGAVLASSAVVLTNNIFSLQTSEQYVALDTNLSWIAGTNNLFYGAGNPLGVFTNSVTGNPEFVSTATHNFHLQSTSAAIDAGATVALATDYDGIARPQGTAYDIGAYEYVAAATTSGTLTASPASLSFENTVVGQSSETTAVLTNSGTASVTISQLNSNNANFQVSGLSVPTTLTPGESATLSVSFVPSTAGTITGTISVAGNAANSPVNISVSGTAQAATAAISFSPTSLTFASQNLGTQSAAQSVTITNSGTAALTISAISASGDFTQTNNCPASLAVNATCTVSVVFAPTAVGSRTGSISVTDNAASSPQAVSLSGTAVGVPAISFSPTSLTFASQTVGTTSSTQAITLTNSGTAALTISGIAASGNFSESNTCPASLAAAATCTITVAFSPTATGSLTGTITVTDNAASSPQAVSLTGTAVAALTITSTSLPSGTVGTPYSTTLTAANGTAPYTWTDPSCSGACNTGMGFSTTGVLSGTPVNAGTSTFTFLVTDAAGHTATTQLSITIAAGTPVASLSPTSLTFAGQTVGTTSSTQAITLTNSGTTALTISGIAASGNFSESNNCPASLAAAATCTINVAFSPTATGSLTGTITVTDNASGGSQTVSLSGTGNAAPTATLQASASSLSFGGITAGTTSTQTVVISNTGTASATISAISTGNSAFTVSGATLPATIAAGSSLTLTVTFAPTSAASYSGTLAITSNATDSTLSVGLSGTGNAVAHSVTLSWSDSASGLSGYNVYRSTTSGTGYAKINSSLDATTSYVDTAVVAGTTYYYVVTAVNSSGNESAYSAQVSATIP